MTNPAFSPENIRKVSLCCMCIYRSELPLSTAAAVAAAAAGAALIASREFFFHDHGMLVLMSALDHIKWLYIH
jgi:hypothetical protein